MAVQLPNLNDLFSLQDILDYEADSDEEWEEEEPGESLSHSEGVSCLHAAIFVCSRITGSQESPKQGES